MTEGRHDGASRVTLSYNRVDLSNRVAL
jgi:hypothetical protein